MRASFLATQHKDRFILIPVHLAGGGGHIVDNAGDVDGAADGDIHLRGALDECLWLQD